MSHRINRETRVRQIARAEGIKLTPRGEPIFARDIDHMREIRQRDLRSDTQKNIDADIDAAHAND